MKLYYASTLGFQRQQRTAFHLALSQQRKQEWRKRHFKQFLDEQIKREVRNDAKQ